MKCGIALTSLFQRLSCDLCTGCNAVFSTFLESQHQPCEYSLRDHLKCRSCCIRLFTVLYYVNYFSTITKSGKKTKKLQHKQNQISKQTPQKYKQAKLYLIVIVTFDHYTNLTALNFRKGRIWKTVKWKLLFKLLQKWYL